MRFRILLLFLCSSTLYAQQHYFDLNLAFHVNQDDFYFSRQQQALGHELAPGGVKFGMGLSYAYAFQKQNSWNVGVRADFAYRSYTSRVVVDEGRSFGTDYQALYTDVMLGVGRNFTISKNADLGYKLYFGLGIPLQQDDSDGSDPNLVKVDQVLPFVELNFQAALLYSKKKFHAWTIGASPFVRAYFDPMYDQVVGVSESNGPFLAFGLNVNIGYMSFRKH